MTSSELIAQEPSLEGRSARGAAERKRGKQCARWKRSTVIGTVVADSRTGG